MTEPLKHSCPKHLAEGITLVQCSVNGPSGVPAPEWQLGLVRLLKYCLGHAREAWKLVGWCFLAVSNLS